MSSTSSASALAASFDQNTPQDEATSLARLLETSTAILRQAIDLVEDGLTSDDQLSIQSNHIPGSTIGAPIRPFNQYRIWAFMIQYIVYVRETPQTC